MNQNECLLVYVGTVIASYTQNDLLIYTPPNWKVYLEHYRSDASLGNTELKYD